MRINRSKDGAIVNSRALTTDQVYHKTGLCPACNDFVFKSWPKGWSSHAAKKCGGLIASGEKI